MKRMNTLNNIICALLLAATMSVTAFAAEPAVIPQGGTDASVTTESKEDNNAKNMLVSGTVTDVQANKDYTTITISNDDMGMVFHADPTAFVIDKKTNKYLTVADIKTGMRITAVLDKMSPMTLSLPPQTSGAIGFVINSDQGFVDLSVYNEELVNFENTLKLNLGSETQIADVNGTKKLFGADDLKGSECLVFYTVSTRSIPAQTTPEFVLILNTAEELTTAQDSSIVGTETIFYVPLRTLAEAKGYQVAWDSAAKQIVLTKNDIKAVLTLGSTAFDFEHLTKDMKPLDLMEKLDLAVKLENGTAMVPNTFIEAL